MDRNKDEFPVKATIYDMNKVATHIMKPAEFSPGRICLHVTLEVDIITFFDVIWVEGAAQHQRDNWRN
jgi:hypothetical protein